MKSQGVKLPSWVSIDTKKTATIRNQSKLRRNRPAGEAAPAPKVEDEVSAEIETATPATTVDEVTQPPVVEATLAEEPVAEATTEPESIEPEATVPQTEDATAETTSAAEEPIEK
jgi:hypothetical protein